MMDVFAINELGNEWELMVWRFVVGGVRVVVGRQKGKQLIVESMVTKEV